MKKIKFLIITYCLVSLFTVTGCVKPAKVDVYEEIQPYETAFVVPLEGNSKDQKQMMSIEFLEKSKVATKRIYIPQTEVKTGRFYWNIKYVPTIRIIRVDRSPISFEWVKNKAIPVESKDSIGFKVGININAYIDEKDTAVFLYYYPSKNLQTVLSKEVYSQATEILSREFAKYDLEGSPDICDKNGKIIKEGEFGAREMKGDIVDTAKKHLVNYFAKKGVTITTFGLVGGLTYEDKEIQTAINDNFKSELEIKNRRNERIAQEEINTKELSIAENDRKKAEEFAKAAEARTKQMNLEIAMIKAQAQKIAAEKWNGQLPANILPQNSNILFPLNSSNSN